MTKSLNKTRKRGIAMLWLQEQSNCVDDSVCIEWPWPETVHGTGYPTVGVNRKIIKASHIVLELSGKLRPEGMQALHSCDNPMCCNPTHLRWGTQSDNLRDCIERNRLSTPYVQGSDHLLAKLTDHDVQVIRAIVGLGFSRRSVANMFNVGRTTVIDIMSGKRWSHV